MFSALQRLWQDAKIACNPVCSEARERRILTYRLLETERAKPEGQQDKAAIRRWRLEWARISLGFDQVRRRRASTAVRLRSSARCLM